LTRLLRNVFSTFPYSVQKHTRKDFQQALAKQVEEFDPSLIHCEWSPYAAYLEPHRRVPSVVVAHNVESVIWARRAALASNPVSRWFFGLQARRMERFERTHLKKANQVIAVSDVDADVFHGWGIRTHTVDNGVDVDQYQSAPGFERADRMLFLASLDWFPNLDALKFFIHEIYPLIRKGDARTRLRVVGRRLSKTDASTLRQTPGVEVIGEVSDVRDELQQAGVVVVPLRIGGGSRLKILEAFAAGKAVVSTTVGAEGLEVKNGEHLRIADNPADFSRVVLELLADPAARQRLGSQARALVEQKYGWDSLSRRMEDTWLTVSGGRP
jgi:glycosyltransferase involved in cell wall biosynthesis